MAPRKWQQRSISVLGFALKAYRNKHSFTQDDLSAIINTDPRNIRRWENGETTLTDVYELKRIADRLGLAHEHLGIPSSIYTPLPVEQIGAMVERAWALIDDARIMEAKAITENLVVEVSPQLASQDAEHLYVFARMYHVAAHAISLYSRTTEVAQAIYYYQQMEYFARELHNDTLINIALTYQGDMFRRKGDVLRAIEYLEAARDTTPAADMAARGNAMQLLGRAYWRAGKADEFREALGRAEELACKVQDIENRSTGNQYNINMVYDEYAKGYDHFEQWPLALDYVDKAEKVRPLTKSAVVLLKVARAEILIHSGDITNGEPLAVEAAIHSRMNGHYRRLERIYALKRYVNRQVLQYSKTELALSEALEGPNEYNK